MAKDDRLSTRCSNEFKGKLNDMCKKLNKSQIEVLELGLDLLDDALECKDLIQQGEVDKEIIFARLVLNKFRKIKKEENNV